LLCCWSAGGAAWTETAGADLWPHSSTEAGSGGSRRGARDQAGALTRRKQAQERQSGGADHSGFTAQCGRPKRQIPEIQNFTTGRELLGDPWRGQRPGFIEGPVDDHRIRVQAPNHIGNTDSQIPAEIGRASCREKVTQTRAETSFT